MAKTILRKTPQMCAVKVAGSGVTETITLATDLLTSTETVAGTPTVDIIAIRWSGAAAAIASITRGGTIISTLTGAYSSTLDFRDGQFRDNVNNTGDLVIVTTGQMEVWLELRKVTGYASKIETAMFGAYDNESAVGS